MAAMPGKGKQGDRGDAALAQRFLSQRLFSKTSVQDKKNNY